MYIVFLIIALLFNALANILMKAANFHCSLPADPTSFDKLKGLYLSWPFITGLAAFGLNLLFYTQALNKMDLSIAYPIMTGSGFVIIGIAGYFLFNERLTSGQMIGITCILAGIVLVARHAT